MSTHQGWVYTDKVKDHFVNPRNILRDPTGYEEDGKGEVGNIQCGDQMIVFIKVDGEQRIQECKWLTYGCASAIASTSVLSEMVVGMPLEEAYHISPKQIAGALGQLPDHKVHCSVLGDKALRAAINDYYERQGLTDKVRREEAAVICECMNVTDHEIEEAVLEGTRTFIELQEITKISTTCGKCNEKAQELLREYVEEHFGGSVAGA